MSPDQIINALTVERGRRNWSQQRLADMLGTTQSAISEWECGKSRPSVDSLGRWAGALGLTLSLEWLPNAQTNHLASCTSCSEGRS